MLVTYGALGGIVLRYPFELRFGQETFAFHNRLRVIHFRSLFAQQLAAALPICIATHMQMR